MSETAITRSPDLIMPRALSREKVLLRLLSMSSEKPRRNGIKPHCRFKRLLTEVSVVNAKIGQSGRDRDRRDAMCPSFVYTNSASTSRLLAVKSSNNTNYSICMISNNMDTYLRK